MSNNKKTNFMDTYQRFLEIEEKLKVLLKDLRIESRSIADFIVKNPDKSPVPLVYKDEAGKIESDSYIREDLSTLIGYELPCCSREQGNFTVVILFKNITQEMLEAEGCLENAKVGKLREMAKTIHPEAKIINEDVAASMWHFCAVYYTIRFLLGEKGFEIPDIQVLSSSEEYDSDDSPFINWNSSCGYWNYRDDDGGSGVIRGQLPMWCYYVKK